MTSILKRKKLFSKVRVKAAWLVELFCAKNVFKFLIVIFFLSQQRKTQAVEWKMSDLSLKNDVSDTDKKDPLAAPNTTPTTATTTKTDSKTSESSSSSPVIVAPKTEQ